MTQFRSKKDGTHYPLKGGKQKYPRQPKGASDYNGDMIKPGDSIIAIEDVYLPGATEPIITEGSHEAVKEVFDTGHISLLYLDNQVFESNHFEGNFTKFRQKTEPEFILGQRVVYKTPMFGEYAGKRTLMLEVDKEKGVYMTVPQYRKHLKE